MKKKIGFGSIAIVLSILGIFLSITFKKSGVCYGDNIINFLGLKAWSNIINGTHYTIFYMLILFIPSVILGIKFKDDFGAKLGRNISIFLVVIIAVSPLGMINYNDSAKITIEENISTPDIDIKNITLEEVTNIQPGMSYNKIISKLGVTKNVGFGAHVLVYLVDNKDFLNIFFANINDICDKSGKELLEQSINYALINKAYNYLNDEIKSQIIDINKATIKKLKIKDSEYTYVDKSMQMNTLKNKELMIVDFKIDVMSMPNNVIVRLDEGTKEILGLGLVE